MSVAAPLFEYERDAVRVKACYLSQNGKEVHKKFSVDPNLTSFDTLRSLLSRAFDVSDNFRLAYLCSGDWIPLLSDWDLDAAVLCASEPSLRLVLTDESRILSTTTMDSMGRFEATSPATPATTPSELADLEKTITNLLPSQDTITSLVASSNRASASFLRKHYNQTLPALTKCIHKAFSVGSENVAARPMTSATLMTSPNGATPEKPQFQLTPTEIGSSKPPLSDQMFRSFMNNVGELVRARELRLAIYHGGVESQLRKVVWKHILGVYPSNLNGRERMDYMRQKSSEYESLKSTWIDLVAQGQVPDKVKFVTNMIRKDVLRTDRHHKFFANEGNENVTTLFNILTTYALNHPSVGYCQGMSDLLSPLLVTMNDESHAYICFCALMHRLKKNFLSDGIAMTQKFQHLSEGLLYYDPEFYAYLKRHQADDLLFCYRWLLLEMKREFAFEDALRVMETLWASLPPTYPEGDLGLSLFEEKFVVMSKFDLAAALTPKRPGEMTFSKMVSLRRRTSSAGLTISPQKRLQRFLSRNGSNESGAPANSEHQRIRSVGSADLDHPKEARPKNAAKPLIKSHSHLAVGKKDNSAGPTAVASTETSSSSVKQSPKRLITNLKDFSKLTKSNSGDDKSDVCQMTQSSTDDFEDDDDDNDDSKEIDDDIFSSVVRVDDGSSDVSYSNGGGGGMTLTMTCEKLPEPTEFGDGNPFLMFLCLACLLQHRDHIIREQFDYQEIAMYFDRMVRKHDVEKTLAQARKMFAEYLNDDWSSEKPNC